MAYLASFYIILLVGLVWGLAAERYHIFPHSFIKQVELFWAGGEAEAGLSLADKLINDINFSPHRFIVTFTPNTDREYKTLDLLNANPRRDGPRLYMSEDAAQGYRLLYGPFDLKGGIHAALLLDETGKVIHSWPVATDKSDVNVYPHGLEVFPDGTLIVSFDSGMILQKINWCGERIWERRGDYTHSLSADGEGALWAVKGNGFEKIDSMSGDSKDYISVEDIIQANPDSDILSLRQQDITLPKEGEPTANQWQHDPWHFNDVEPLPADIAGKFPDFLPGDLLISARSLNLVFVMDPIAHTIKWWSVGASRRQHDPDWQNDGSISIFDNRMDRGPMRIVSVKPGQQKNKIIYDGDKDGAYSRIRGKHQILDNGNVLVTVTQQGRVIEVTPDNRVVFEFINDFNQQRNEVLLVSEARFIPKFFFNHPMPISCSSP